jgi:hypothetical protein
MPHTEKELETEIARLERDSLKKPRDFAILRRLAECRQELRSLDHTPTVVFDGRSPPPPRPRARAVPPPVPKAVK